MCSKLIILESTRINSYKLDRTMRLIFTSKLKNGVDKEMNIFLLEKVRCLLSNAQLDKSF